MTADDHTPDRETRVARMLSAAARTERAPESLHAQVAAMRSRAGAPRTSGRRIGLIGPALNYVTLALPLVAAIVVALVLTLGGGPGAPSIAQAASLATRGPSAPAPRPDPSAPSSLLEAHVGGLHFPNWAGAAGWRSVGQRRDSLGDRTVTTVYYASAGERIAYSIVSAPALAGLKTHGERYATMRQHGRTVVVWEESDHTCVLSGSGISAAALWQLAVSGASA